MPIFQDQHVENYKVFGALRSADRANLHTICDTENNGYSIIVEDTGFNQLGDYAIELVPCSCCEKLNYIVFALADVDEDRWCVMAIDLDRKDPSNPIAGREWEGLQAALSYVRLRAGELKSDKVWQRQFKAYQEQERAALQALKEEEGND